jgi:hypothetical protein
MPLQARADEASRGTGVTSGMSVTNSAVATNPLNAAFTQGVESSASGQQTPPRPIVERSTQVLVRESPAPIDRHASDATQVMALPTVSREITPTRRPTDPSRSPGTDDTQAASSTVATDVVVTETSPRSASLAMSTVFVGGRSPTRSPNSSHAKNAADAEIEQRGESSVVSMARARAAQSAHNSLVLAAERVPVSNAPRPTLLLRKRAAAPVQPSQVQDATHHMSAERTRMPRTPRTQTPSLQSKALPAQMAPPATPAQAPINIERIADEVGRVLERRLEMTARRRGRHAWS